MSWLIRTSLELRLLVMILAVVLVVVGIRNSDSVPLDVFPEFAPPLVEIQTEAPGSRLKMSRVSLRCQSKRCEWYPLCANSPFKVRIRTFERAHDF